MWFTLWFESHFIIYLDVCKGRRAQGIWFSMAYLYLIISVNMAVASFIMIQHRNKMIVRAIGLILAYIAAGIALKVFYMLSSVWKFYEVIHSFLQKNDSHLEHRSGRWRTILLAQDLILRYSKC